MWNEVIYALKREVVESAERLSRSFQRMPRYGAGRKTALNDAKRFPGKYSASHLAGGTPGSRECLRRAGVAKLVQHGGVA